MSNTFSSNLLSPFSNILPSLAPRIRQLTGGTFASPRLEEEEAFTSDEIKDEEDVVKVELRIGGMTVSLIFLQRKYFLLLQRIVLPMLGCIGLTCPIYDKP